jgi:nucleotide-binding universal stress UspA family protein
MAMARVEAVLAMPDKPLLLCYDGSENAKHAIREAATLLAPRPAIVLSVWQDAAAIPSLAWAGAALPDIEPVLAAAREGAERMAEEGAGIARATGFDAVAIAAEAKGPIWAAVQQAAEEHDASAIVVGTRGLSGIKSLLLGSVSTGIVHHAHRPTVVVAPDGRG